MLPGTLCDARIFTPVLGRLDQRAVVPELTGANSASEMARLILADAPETMSLCGFSLGAIVALEVVAQAPDRVERLALVGCNPAPLARDAQAARATADRNDFVADTDPAVVHEMARAASDDTWRAQTAITLSRPDSRPRLSRITCPTLILCGADDSICPPTMSRAIAASIPGARLAIIEQAGHYVTIEQPDAVADELAAWLATPPQS
jgi:pimeloyl-ACP methyl ester carboxylesterase